MFQSHPENAKDKTTYPVSVKTYFKYFSSHCGDDRTQKEDWCVSKRFIISWESWYR